jgi:hypothetical protein
MVGALTFVQPTAADELSDKLLATTRPDVVCAWDSFVSVEIAGGLCKWAQSPSDAAIQQAIALMEAHLVSISDFPVMEVLHQRRAWHLDMLSVGKTEADMAKACREWDWMHGLARIHEQPPSWFLNTTKKILSGPAPERTVC